ncbi:MAG: RluA family pseudouridine synthase [Chlamydiales bacterium]
MTETPKVLYLDNHLLIANKPAGLLTQETKGNADSIENWGKKFLQLKTKKPKVFLQVAHRLDRVASGIVVLARTSKALSRLHEMFRLRQTKKIYLAWVEKPFMNQGGEYRDSITHESYIAKVIKTGQPANAHLSYQVIQEVDSCSLVKIILYTGKYHQIRCQFASHGHPILGDSKYGSSFLLSNGIALHHTEFHYTHPITKQPTIVASPPKFVEVEQKYNLLHSLSSTHS